MAGFDERRPLLRPSTPAINGSSNTSCISSKCKMRLSCGAILLTEMFERTAFYGVVGNLVLFLNLKPYLWEAQNAANALFIFTGITYMTSILGGWIADSLLGRFKTIIIFFFIYMGGYAFLPILANTSKGEGENKTMVAPSWCSSECCNASRLSLADPDVGTEPGRECCAWAVFLVLAIVGLGTSGTRANIAPFGAEQVRQSGPNATRTFFNWFYWSTNLGSFIALGAIAYVQQEINFFLGYIVPAGFLCLAAVIFMIAGPFYTLLKPSGSPLANTAKVIIEAFRLKCRSKNRYQVIKRSNVDKMSTASDESHGFLDNAKVRHGGSFHDSLVDDVKALLKVMCVLFTFIPYWIVYMQMETTFPIQGLHMRLKLFLNQSTAEHEHVFKIPAAWLSLFDVIFVIILIPFFDRVVYPCLDKRGYPISLRTRIGIGMAFAMVAVASAGILETCRLNIFNHTLHGNLTQKIGKTTYHDANLSVLWQIPQYTLIGVSEVFTSVAGLEFAYTESPRSLQGIVMGLFWFVMGAGSMLGTALVYMFTGTLFKGQDHGNINDSHLDYFYYILAGIQAFGLILFLVVIRCLGIGNAVNRSSRPAVTYPKSLHIRSQSQNPERYLQHRNSTTPVEIS